MIHFEREALEILRGAYLRKKGQNKNFSLRWMAKKLELSPSYLSQVLKGRRSIPVRSVPSLCILLDIDGDSRDRVIRSKIYPEGASFGLPVEPKGSSGGDIPKISWSYKAPQCSGLLDDASFLPILNATLLVDYDGSPEFIAKRLRISPEKAAAAMHQLQLLGALSLRDGKLVKSERFINFNSRANKDRIRQFHAACLQRASVEMFSRPEPNHVERRTIATNIATIPRRKVAWAKQRLLDVIEEITAEITLDDAEEIYQIGFQFFPLTDFVE